MHVGIPPRRSVTLLSDDAEGNIVNTPIYDSGVAVSKEDNLVVVLAEDSHKALTEDDIIVVLVGGILIIGCLKETLVLFCAKQPHHHLRGRHPCRCPRRG